MILAVDIGNTNIVLGCLGEENIVLECRISTDMQKTEAEYAVLLKHVLEAYHIDLQRIEGVVLSSVVPPITAAIKTAAEQITGCRAVEAGAFAKHGLTFAYGNGEGVGSDLIVAAVAGLAAYKPPLIIIDLGTSTTFSAIDRNGVFLGCAFLPGIRISLDALSARAAQLPAVPLEAPPFAIGRNTVECMQSGIVYGNAALIDGMIDRMEAELGGKATVLATGGLAASIVPHCRHEIQCDGALLLRGLWHIYQKNQA